MKHDAISPRELPRLIRRVREAGFFAGVRGGHSVTIENAPAPLIGAPPVLFGIQRGATWIHDRASNIHDAADVINRLAKGARA